MFSERLKQLRKSMKLTQKELAEKLGLSPGAIGLYEQNRRTPDIELLNKIATYFDVTVDYLLGRTNNPTTVRIEGDKLPKELREIGIEYLTIAKEMADKEIPPEDIKKIIDVLVNRNK
ncbi:helix-turn-helix domain-containing protein [Tepidibacter thalassicus]|uniref:DNA-binding transcriptional regulator, XRE-family HTH domain n=1 Tax=Tepidibacter thalassicus DSM 15285 TaxID=1123350 RepID=A0A1M5PWT8_9FIRM|nr:helix-turn-helix transcriptional regulator [Tepidibacter thalassicus]SHH06487.1 DNA-binding transcriptional regulator, XRE-family HTH domain [Tepidibacter thalassicus DSM 15285]